MYPVGVLNNDVGRRFFVVMFVISIVLMVMMICVIFVVANRLEPNNVLAKNSSKI